MFTGKRFLLVGFGAEAEAQLSTLVVENYGKVLSGRFRGVADYAIVPLLGCEVEATVDEVVTDTWLVRCGKMFGNRHAIIIACTKDTHSINDPFAGHVGS